MTARELAQFRWFKAKKFGSGMRLFAEMPAEAGAMKQMVTVDEQLYVICENGLYLVEEGRATRVEMSV